MGLEATYKIISQGGCEGVARTKDETLGYGTHHFRCCPHVIHGYHIVTNTVSPNSKDGFAHLDSMTIHDCPHCVNGYSAQGNDRVLVTTSNSENTSQAISQVTASSSSQSGGKPAHALHMLINETCGWGTTITASPNVNTPTTVNEITPPDPEPPSEKYKYIKCDGREGEIILDNNDSDVIKVEDENGIGQCYQYDDETEDELTTPIPEVENYDDCDTCMGIILEPVIHCTCKDTLPFYLSYIIPESGIYRVVYRAGAIRRQPGKRWNQCYVQPCSPTKCNPSTYVTCWHPFIHTDTLGYIGIPGFNTTGWVEYDDAEEANIDSFITANFNAGEEVKIFYNDNRCGDNEGTLTIDFQLQD